MRGRAESRELIVAGESNNMYGAGTSSIRVNEERAMKDSEKQVWARFALVLGLLATSILATVSLMALNKPPERKPEASIAPLIEVVPARAEAVRFAIRSQGAVVPRNETILSAEVAGAIVSLSPKFVSGGLFEAGEELLRIDPTNYRAAVEQAEALVAQRQIEFDGASRLREQGYRAEAEFASARAALAAANADLVRARRNLERTRVSVPYAGLVRAREADLGQYVNIGSRLGVVFSTVAAEVRLPLTDNDLAFVDIPDPAQATDGRLTEGPAVQLWTEQGGQRLQWQGSIIRSEAVVDPSTRATFVVAEVSDPYRRGVGSENRELLPIGTFVGAEIEGRLVEDIVVVPRSALRGNGQLVVVDEEDRLSVRDVDILRADADNAYLSSGVADGELVSLTVIDNPLNGMRVRTERRGVSGASSVDGAL